jgi:uncharacterized protein
MEYQVISADDHVDLRFMPKDLWTSRLPTAFRDEAPHVEELEQGPTWIFKGKVVAPWGFYTAAQGSGAVWALERGGALVEGDPRPTTPALRLADMDRDGVDASVLYGPPERFLFDDPDMRGACFSAYNDWLVEFCAAAPERFIGAAQLDYEDPDYSAKELERVAGLGLRHANVLAPVASPPWYSPEWERFWSVAEETGIPIASHLIAVVRRERPADNGAVAAATNAVFNEQSLVEPFVGLIFAGVLDRHPGLRLVMAESGLAWIPNMIQRLDRFHRTRVSGDPIPARPPSEYFSEQIWMTFQDDPFGSSMIPLLCEDKVMWASDYPHPASTWPDSRAAIERQLAQFAPALRAKVVVENARQLYDL